MLRKHFRQTVKLFLDISRKFKVFVVNRIEMTRDHTGIHQWHYIGTKVNPADYSSRGIDVANDKAVQKWF